MSEPKFTGVWIPASVFQTQTISLTAKVVYGVVDALDNEEGCFASNAYLSRHLGLSVRQLQTILSELEDAKLILRVACEGHRVIRTVEKVALTNALASTQVTRSEGGAENRTGGVKKTARGGCGKPHTYSKEDNKVDKDTGTASPMASVIKDLDSIPWESALPFSSEAFSKAWQSWIDYRKELKKPLKDATVTAQWKEFVAWGEAKSIASIEQSIKNGWQGLFEPKQVFGKGNTNVLTARDHEAF
jgi:hypothetical protein